MKVLYVFDCDGVLVDSSARYATVKTPEGREVIDLEFWRANECKALEVDKLLPLAAFYQEKLFQDVEAFAVIATARQMGTNCPQMQHIINVLGCGKPPQTLIYRKEGDTRGGAALKLAGLRKLLNLKQFQGVRIEVFEDNIAYLQKICDTLKAWGFEVVGHYIPSNQGH